MRALVHLPLEITVDGKNGVIRQRVGDLEEEVVEIRISKDQAVAIADFLIKSFKLRKSDMVDGDVAGFDQFWLSYPRKEAKAESLRIWKQRRLSESAVKILTHIEACKQTEQWQKGFIPHASTYLNQRRFEDDLPSGGDPFMGTI
jgi:hypothetical protein